MTGGGKVFLLVVLVLTLSWGMTSSSFGSLAYYNIFVASYNDYGPPILNQLKVLPDGEILDPNIQYDLGGNSSFNTEGVLAVTTDYHFLLASPNAPGVFCFQILPNGNLLVVSSTNDGSGGGYITVTPNNQLVITADNMIYTLTSTGDLVNGTLSAQSISNQKADPLGRGILSWSNLRSFSAFTINYDNRTLDLTTTYPTGIGNNFKFTFTPKGNLGFLTGFASVSPNGGNLWVLNIDSGFKVTTTSQIFTLSGGGNPTTPAISPDSRFLWLPTGYYIQLYSINTATGVVTDTGQKFYALNSTTGTNFQRNTPDGRLAIVATGGGFSSAWINYDGSLTWTGYNLSYYTGKLQDYVIVPVYVTGIPKELWKDPPPDMEIKSKESIHGNPLP